MDTQVADFNLIETVRDAAKYGDKIDALIKAKKEWDNAKADAEAAFKDLAKQKIDTDNYVNGRKAELAAKQVEHDKAAKEAADRIELAKSQMAEILKVREQNTAMSQALTARESALANRERNLGDREAGIAARQAEAARGSDLVRRQLAHLAAMPKQ